MSARVRLVLITTQGNSSRFGVTRETLEARRKMKALPGWFPAKCPFLTTFGQWLCTAGTPRKALLFSVWSEDTGTRVETACFIILRLHGFSCQLQSVQWSVARFAKACIQFSDRPPGMRKVTGSITHCGMLWLSSTLLDREREMHASPGVRDSNPIILSEEFV